MQNNIINKISPCVRLISLFILCISLFMAESMFLILFITTLTLILMLITSKKVNLYVNIFKKIYILLLFFLIVYIIMFEYNVFTVIVFAYKLLIAAVLFIVFYLNINFNQFHQSVYGCLKYLEKFKFNVEQFSFDFTLSLYFLKTLINKKEELSRIQEMYGKKQHNLKNYVFPIFISSVNELNEFQLHLKTKFYKLNYKSSNIFSKFVLALVLILFIFVVFKEVIL